MVNTVLDTVTVAVILSLYSSALAQPTQCPPVAGKPSCACQPPGEAIIDVSELANTNGTPRYVEVYISGSRGDMCTCM